MSNDVLLKENSLIYEALAERIYANPVLTAMREIVANALDAHRRNNIQVKPKVTFDYCLSENNIEEYVVTIRDYATGILPEDYENAFTFFFSDKNEEENMSGAYGLGIKSPYGLLYNIKRQKELIASKADRYLGSESFYIMSYHSGEVTTYRHYIDIESGKLKYDVAYKIRTEEPDGLSVVFNIPIAPDTKIPSEPVENISSIPLFADHTMIASFYGEIDVVMCGYEIEHERHRIDISDGVYVVKNLPSTLTHGAYFTKGDIAYRPELYTFFSIEPYTLFIDVEKLNIPNNITISRDNMVLTENSIAHSWIRKTHNDIHSRSAYAKLASIVEEKALSLPFPDNIRYLSKTFTHTNFPEEWDSITNKEDFLEIKYGTFGNFMVHNLTSIVRCGRKYSIGGRDGNLYSSAKGSVKLSNIVDGRVLYVVNTTKKNMRVGYAAIIREGMYDEIMEVERDHEIELLKKVGVPFVYANTIDNTEQNKDMVCRFSINGRVFSQRVSISELLKEFPNLYYDGIGQPMRLHNTYSVEKGEVGIRFIREDGVGLSFPERFLKVTTQLENGDTIEYRVGGHLLRLSDSSSKATRKLFEEAFERGDIKDVYELSNSRYFGRTLTKGETLFQFIRSNKNYIFRIINTSDLINEIADLLGVKDKDAIVSSPQHEEYSAKLEAITTDSMNNIEGRIGEISYLLMKHWYSRDRFCVELHKEIIEEMSKRVDMMGVEKILLRIVNNRA